MLSAWGQTALTFPSTTCRCVSSHPSSPQPLLRPGQGGRCLKLWPAPIPHVSLTPLQGQSALTSRRHCGFRPSASLPSIAASNASSTSRWGVGFGTGWEAVSPGRHWEEVKITQWDVCFSFSQRIPCPRLSPPKNLLLPMKQPHAVASWATGESFPTEDRLAALSCAGRPCSPDDLS